VLPLAAPRLLARPGCSVAAVIRPETIIEEQAAVLPLAAPRLLARPGCSVAAVIRP
jgi:hypothetical protein